MNPKIKVLSALGLEIGYKTHKSAKRIYAFDSLNAHPGEFIAIVGRNGIGKSTLLKTLAGFLLPMGGQVQLNGQSVHTMHRRLRAHGISFVPSDLNLIDNLMVRDFVAMGRYPYTGWSNSLQKCDWELVNSAMEMVGISDLRHRDIAAISDGERHRAMVAFALAQDTQVIILDEPTAFLDIPNKIEIVQLLHRQTRLGKTVLFTTHDVNAAFRAVDTIWMMLAGKFEMGSPEDLVLNGCFDAFLEGTYVKFDILSGNFYSPRQLMSTICLQISSELPYLWTRHALERIGFAVTNNPGEGSCIIKHCQTNGEPTWELIGLEQNKSFSSLRHLCMYFQEQQNSASF